MPPRFAWVGCEGVSAPGAQEQGPGASGTSTGPAGQRHTEGSPRPRPRLRHRLAWPGPAFAQTLQLALGPRCQALLHSTGCQSVVQAGHERRHPPASASGALARWLLGSSVQRGLPKAMSAVGPPPWAAPARLRRDTRSFVRSAASLGSGPRCRAQRGRINARSVASANCVGAAGDTQARGDPRDPRLAVGSPVAREPKWSSAGTGSLFPRRVIFKPPQPSHP